MELIIREALPDDAAVFIDCLISCWKTSYRLRRTPTCNEQYLFYVKVD